MQPKKGFLFFPHFYREDYCLDCSASDLGSRALDQSGLWCVSLGPIFQIKQDTEELHVCLFPHKYAVKI